MKIVQIEPLAIPFDTLVKTQDYYNSLGHEFVFYNDRVETKDEIILRAKDAEVMIVSNIPIDKEIISSCKNLKFINVAFSGIDHIDIDECNKHNISVSNSAGYSTEAVSELVLGMTISLLRNIPDLDRNTRNLMTRNDFLGVELSGKTVGIIGTGNIGLATARLFNAFGCNVLAFSRTKKNVDYIDYVEMDYLFKQSDIISLHIPSNSDTNKLINSSLLSLMKESAVLINTARAQIVDNVYLANMLNQGRISGAAIDVYETEPPLPKDHPLLSAKNTILLPHIAYATNESMVKRYKIVKSNLDDYLNGKLKGSRI